MRMSELKKREVINVCDCRRLGFVGDLDIDPCSGKILCDHCAGTGLRLRIFRARERFCDPV